MKKNIFIPLFLLLFSLTGTAGERDLNICYANSEFIYNNDVISSKVSCIIKDSDNYIWMGTNDGLIRYDGYTFKNFRSNFRSPEIFKNNRITALAEDINKNIWIGTIDGLYIYDHQSREINEIRIPGTQSNRIINICMGKGKEIWIATNNRLYKFDKQTQQILEYAYPFEGSIPNLVIRDINGNIWLTFPMSGLYKFNVQNEKFIKYYNCHPQNNITALFEDNKGDIWFSVWNHGLTKMQNSNELEGPKFKRFTHSKNPESLRGNIVYQISQDPQSNKLWIFTNKGISVMSETEGKERFTDFNLDKLSPNYNFDYGNILFDNNGILWLCSRTKGVARISFLNENIQEFFLKDNQMPIKITEIHRFRNGRIWLALEKLGIIGYDEKTHASYQLDGKEYDILKNLKNVSQIHEQDEHTVVVHSIFSRSFIIQERQNHINITTHDNPQGYRNIKFHKDKNGNKIFIHNKGLKVYDRNDSLIYTNDSIPLISTYAYDPKNDQHWIGCTADGMLKLTIGSHGIGLKNYNTQNGRINNNYILSTFIDINGRVWIGSKGGGISLYDPRTDCFMLKNHDFNISSDEIFNICQYAKDDLWFTTKNSISRILFDKKGKTMLQVIYSTSGRINDIEFVPEAFCASHNNRLIFGGYNGFVSIAPDNLHINNHHNCPIITDVKIKDNSIFNNGEKKRHTRKNDLDYIWLDHSENDLRMEFSSMDMTNQHSVRYAYKLEGVDSEWRISNVGENFAIYNNLSRGKYLFSVKVLNEQEPKTSQMMIVVKPDIYHTPFAYIIYLTLFLVISFVISYLLIKNYRGKLNEHRILDQKKKSEELNEMKLKFFTNVSHELLTPLSIISCGIEDLTESHGKDPSQEVDIIKENIDRLTKLIRQVLEFKKIESGNSRLKVSYGDISAFIENICQINFKPLIKEKKINFSFLSTKDEILGFFDKDKIDKIIYNLLSNAFKYNHEYAIINVVVDVCKVHDFQGVKITVRDNGNGIDKDMQKYIFNRYVDGDYRKFNTSGTGIGLSLTKDLTELHHGEIHLNSDKNQGCEFIITIPLEANAYTDEEMDADALPMKEETGNCKKENLLFDKTKKTLLIVEDSRDLQSIMKNILSGKYNILCASSGTEGLDILKTNDIDLIITDVMMPHMDGFEMCRHIRNDLSTSHIPIIMLTAKCNEDDKLKGYEIGIDDYMFKPINIKILGLRIEKLLKQVQENITKFKQQNNVQYNSTDEKFIEKAIATAELHLQETDFNLEEYIEEMNVSKSTLYRKLKVLTGMSPSDFIKNIKLKRAYTVMKEKRVSISEIAYEVGFNDPKYFSICFKKEFGLTPTEFLAKYHK